MPDGGGELLELVVVELGEPLPGGLPLDEGVEPELALPDPGDEPDELPAGWLPEPLDVPLPLLGASNVVIGFGDGPVEVVVGVGVVGGLTPVASPGSTTSVGYESWPVSGGSAWR